MGLRSSANHRRSKFKQISQCDNPSETCLHWTHLGIGGNASPLNAATNTSSRIPNLHILSKNLDFLRMRGILLLHFIAAASSFWNGRADDIGSTVGTVEPMVFHPSYTAPFYRFILLYRRTYVLAKPGEYKKTSWNFTSLFLPLCICESWSSIRTLHLYQRRADRLSPFYTRRYPLIGNLRWHIIYSMFLFQYFYWLSGALLFYYRNRIFPSIHMWIFPFFPWSSTVYQKRSI